jgi:hypothetical protein
MSRSSFAIQRGRSGIEVPEDLSSSDYGRQTPANDIPASPALPNVVSFAEEIRKNPSENDALKEEPEGYGAVQVEQRRDAVPSRQSREAFSPTPTG